jgi:hypothetical protein
MRCFYLLAFEEKITYIYKKRLVKFIPEIKKCSLV